MTYYLRQTSRDTEFVCLTPAPRNVFYFAATATTNLLLRQSRDRCRHRNRNLHTAANFPRSASAVTHRRPPPASGATAASTRRPPGRWPGRWQRSSASATLRPQPRPMQRRPVVEDAAQRPLPPTVRSVPPSTTNWLRLLPLTCVMAVNLGPQAALHLSLRRILRMATQAQ